MPTLTEITLRNLKAPERGQKTYTDDSLTGFGVRVLQSGTKTFTLVYGVNRQRLTIGAIRSFRLQMPWWKRSGSSLNSRRVTPGRRRSPGTTELPCSSITARGRTGAGRCGITVAF
jgi:hypothetical protein